MQNVVSNRLDPDPTIINPYVPKKIAKMNKVENQFIEKAIDVCGIIVYSKEDTLDFIEACRDFEIDILGIDAFFIAEKITQPRIEDSVNYSSCPKDKNIYDSALEFISKRDDSLFFEISSYKETVNSKIKK